jgi:hypothetical protein
VSFITFCGADAVGLVSIITVKYMPLWFGFQCPCGSLPGVSLHVWLRSTAQLKLFVHLLLGTGAAVVLFTWVPREFVPRSVKFLGQELPSCSSIQQCMQIMWATVDKCIHILCAMVCMSPVRASEMCVGNHGDGPLFVLPCCALRLPMRRLVASRGPTVHYT